MSDSERPPANVVAFAPERQERVRQIVRSRHAVRVEELRSELGVSTATIRRDLDELEERGALRRVHGGAVAVDVAPHRGALRGQGRQARRGEAAHRRPRRGARRARLTHLPRRRQHLPGAGAPARGADGHHGRHQQPARHRGAGRPRSPPRRRGRRAAAAQPGARGAALRAAARRALRRPCLHGHLQPLARCRPDHDGSRRGLHQGARPLPGPRGRAAGRQQQARHPFVRPCRSSRPDRRRHHRRRPRRGRPPPSSPAAGVRVLVA